MVRFRERWFRFRREDVQPSSRSGKGRILRAWLLPVLCLLLSSCSLVTLSPYLSQNVDVPLLTGASALDSLPNGSVPYQRWRIPGWDDKMRFVWLAGNYDFRQSDKLELILYFHGMHSKDYYPSFKKELEALADKRPDRPFLFVGYVDTPNLSGEDMGKERWKSLVPNENDKPERLFDSINRIYKAFRVTFPHVKKENTTIVLAGFSGGGRVLHAVGNWLARSAKDDPWADVFRSRLTKLVYFDCWFERDVVDTVPVLLENNPSMKIVGTVHMKKPVEHATILADKFNMKPHKERNELVGLDGRLVILRDTSHWNAMISRLAEAL